jgi:L-lactate dehydrogenase complex protein LldG
VGNDFNSGENMSSRDKILSDIKQAVRVPSRLHQDPENIDQRIRQSLKQITPQSPGGLREQFRKELETVSGEYRLCRSAKEAADHLAGLLKKLKFTSLAISGGGEAQEIANLVSKKHSEIKTIIASEMDFAQRRDTLASVPAGLVNVDYAVADIGTVAVLFDRSKSTLPHFLPDCIFAILRPSQMVSNLFELFAKIPPEEAKNMVLVTGPSRTADIEKILILGAHGPRRLLVYMIED